MTLLKSEQCSTSGEIWPFPPLTEAPVSPQLLVKTCISKATHRIDTREIFRAVRARERSRKFGSLAIPAYRQDAPESPPASGNQNPARFNRQCSKRRLQGREAAELWMCAGGSGVSVPCQNMLLLMPVYRRRLGVSPVDKCWCSKRQRPHLPVNISQHRHRCGIVPYRRHKWPRLTITGWRIGWQQANRGECKTSKSGF